MIYKYINTNSPKKKINYSYSEFKGEEFLDSWRDSRNLSHPLIKEYTLNKNIESDTEKLFHNWINSLNQNNFTDLDLLNLLIKRFEVTKKIYNSYNELFRPINSKNYEITSLYILFAIILTQAYKKFENLQFLNALLKVNDINLSNLETLNKVDKDNLKYCLTEETIYIKNLINKLK